MFRDSVSQVVPELALDKSRYWPLARLLTREEGFQLFGDDAVQNGFFRLARSIFERSVRHGGVKGPSLANSNRRRVSDVLNPFNRKS